MRTVKGKALFRGAFPVSSPTFTCTPPMKNLCIPISAVIFVLALNCTSHAQETWTARVVSVDDGDTITVEPVPGGNQVTIRLWGIDCPAIDHPDGPAAKEFVSGNLLFRQVHVENKSVDRHGRIVATVYYFEGKGRYAIQETLLKAGLSWLLPRYCNDANPCNKWAGLQKEARRKRTGLWKHDTPTPH